MNRYAGQLWYTRWGHLWVPISIGLVYSLLFYDSWWVIWSCDLILTKFHPLTINQHMFSECFIEIVSFAGTFLPLKPEGCVSSYYCFSWRNVLRLDNEWKQTSLFVLFYTKLIFNKLNWNLFLCFLTWHRSHQQVILSCEKHLFMVFYSFFYYFDIVNNIHC